MYPSSPRRAAADSSALAQPQLPRANWWLRLTSSGWDRPSETLQDRELARRSRLTSWIILGLALIVLVLLPVGGDDVGSRNALLGVGAGLVVTALLNRRGFTFWAAALLILLICGAVVAALVSQPDGLTIDAVSAYGFFAIAIAVAASILPRYATFYTCVLTIILTCLDFFLQPHAPDLTQDLHKYSSTTIGTLSVLARPIALEIMLAVIAFLWVRGTDEAIRRADRAEEIARLEHQLAERKRQLDLDIQQIQATLVTAANGDFSVRAPLGQDNILWHIGASLNTLLARLQRAGQAEFQLRRTEGEIARLVTALRDSHAGRLPLWPAPSGTAVDALLHELAGGSQPPTSRPTFNNLPDPQAPPQSQQSSQPWNLDPPSNYDPWRRG